MDKLLFYLFLCLLTSCRIGENNSSKVIFAGEIVNPTSTHVILFKGESIIDSARLDEHNRFSFRFDSLNQGLYHFNHSPELQYVYLKEGDSLMIRLNTADFDESLVFSGKGEEINNFLLELFLNNEDELPQIHGYYELEAIAFAHKIDSLKQLKLDLLADLKKEGHLASQEFNIAKASIDYSYNTYKETYPFRHKKVSHGGEMEDLPADFYDYRKKIDFNNKDLTYLRPYYSFMVNHIQNLSYMACSRDCAIHNNVVKNQLHFNIHKLHMVDSLVTEKELKDNLFRYIAFDYLLKAHDSGVNNNKFINEFHKLSSNNRHIQEIDNLFKGIESIQPSKQLPNVYVSTIEGDSISIRDIGKGGKTVFYFWSGVEKRHFDNITKRVAKLSILKPDYKFVGINIRTNESTWRGMLENAKLEKDLQYRADDFEKLTNALIIDKLNKCVITDDTFIVDAFSDIYAAF